MLRNHRRARVLRSAVFAAGILLLIAACLSPHVRSLLLGSQVSTAIILTLAAIVLLPSHLWLTAPLFAGAVYVALRLAIRAKEHAVGLPITWIDIVSMLRSPAVVARAVGYHGSVVLTGIGLGILLLVVAFLLLRLTGRVRVGLLLQRAVEGAVLIGASIPALFLSAQDLQSQIAARYPDIALGLWEPYGQRLLVRRIGPFEYVAFTYVAGATDWLAAEEPPNGPIPTAEIANAAAKYVRGPSPAVLPNIVILHAESSFDPNLIFRLTKPVNLPLWTSGPGTALLGPLRVNVVGGGTQVTQFELFTGLDTRQFGYWGFYTHLAIAPRVRHAFPTYLASKGYFTLASYPVGPDWLGAGKAFRAYGFQKTFYGPDLHLKGDWSETDPDLVRRVSDKGAFQPRRKPLFVYLSTLENHGPHECVHFTQASELMTRLQGNAPFVQDCSINEYLRRARSTSAAMELVLSQLKKLEASTGRPFVLLVYGDHQPWSFTNGDYSVAGGLANAHDTTSFSRYRAGANQNITFYHVITSVHGRSVGPFAATIPVTLLPTILSAYTTQDWSGLYLPVNFLALDICGTDYRRRECREGNNIEAWARTDVFSKSR